MKTNQPTRGFLLFFLFISLLQLNAEPLNVMVEDLTFTRPENWKWAEPTPNSPAVSRFLPLDSHGGTSVDVRFYIIKKDYKSERAALKTQFPEATNNFHEQEIKIGNRKVIYFDIAGTYVSRGHEPKKDQLCVSAAIPLGKEFIYARIQGPIAEVEALVAPFKKMVEDAVTERETDLASN